MLDGVKEIGCVLDASTRNRCIDTLYDEHVRQQPCLFVNRETGKGDRLHFHRRAPKIIDRIEVGSGSPSETANHFIQNQSNKSWHRHRMNACI